MYAFTRYKSGAHFSKSVLVVQPNIQYRSHYEALCAESTFYGAAKA